jgi:hypothetical protein
MKVIPLRELGSLKTADIIRTVIERPAQGLGVSALRERCRVLDALDGASGDGVSGPGLLLEDGDYATLVKALNEFQFGMVSRELLTIADDILGPGSLG